MSVCVLWRCGGAALWECGCGRVWLFGVGAGVHVGGWVNGISQCPTLLVTASLLGRKRGALQQREQVDHAFTASSIELEPGRVLSESSGLAGLSSCGQHARTLWHAEALQTGVTKDAT